MTDSLVSKLLIVLLASSISYAVQEAPAEKEDVLKPVVSLSGMKRIYNNIDIVTSNIKDAQANILSCEKNRAIVIAELQELDKLEREQVGLIKSYEDYLKKANQQSEKNAEGTEALAKFERENRNKLKSSGGKDQLELAAKLTTAQQDLASRQKWSADANEKISRVKKLLTGAKANLKEIQSRREPLKAQLASWTNKQAEFKKLISEFTEKKAELERLADSQKSEPPTETVQ